MGSKNRLTCEEVFLVLDDYLDRELEACERELVESHLEQCARCAGQYRFEETLLRELRDKIQHIDIPLTLKQKISKRLAEEIEKEKN